MLVRNAQNHPARANGNESQERVRFLDLNALFEEYREELLSAITRVLERSSFIGGEDVARFEKSFANWVGPEFTAVGCGNGTDAIMLAAKSLDLPPASEAITPAMTFCATATGLIHAGVKVRLVDVSSDTWTMEPEAARGAMTPNTRVIVPVHLYGQMAPMDEIRKIADETRCFVIEDAAQAHGALWKSKPVGHWGDLAAFSFYPGKNLGAFGDAGAIVSRYPKFIEFCRALGNHGRRTKFEHECLGYNSRLDGMQAAILEVKLRHIDAWNEARRSVAGTYRRELGGVAGLTLPVEHPAAKHVYHLFVVLVENREDFIAYLDDRGIDAGIHYPRAIHQLPMFKEEAFAKEYFPNAERLAHSALSLPMGPTLTEPEIGRVLHAVQSYFGR